MNSQSFMWIAFGVAALIVALALAALLIRCEEPLERWKSCSTRPTKR